MGRGSGGCLLDRPGIVPQRGIRGLVWNTVLVFSLFSVPSSDMGIRRTSGERNVPAGENKSA